ncbi:SRPBCC domain-containing protein [Nocardia panacis]|uniref:SRPBCC domain-containing protein n=1 Tax=Nocardia panacis TaxID=2340916 RepID=A0A3A4KQY4_9NOCA|nr:SRPBCC domain-containing protein [Nocardia panacis]RJO78421.1 SRPBCC domain-containing protein [Nocardia panacis]
MKQADDNRDFTITVAVDRTPQEAFEAIIDVRGWWSQTIQGITDRIGGEFDYHYQDVHRCRIRVTELAPGRKVAWRVLENHFDFIEDRSEWTGTDIVFEISGTDRGTEIHFTHSGLVPRNECYEVCSNAWGGYLTGSLRNLINTGAGQPNPKDDGDAPDHQRAATAVRAERAL